MFSSHPRTPFQPRFCVGCVTGQYGVTVGAKLKPEVNRCKSVAGGFGLLQLQFKSEPGQTKWKEALSGQKGEE